MIEFKDRGDMYHECCQVCESKNIRSIFKIPYYLGENKDLFCTPTYGTNVVHEYYICDDCETRFKNPYNSKEHERRKDSNAGTSKVDAAKKKPHLGFARYKTHIKPYIQSDAKVIISAACGAGPFLRLLKEENKYDRIIGMELIPQCLEYIRSQGMEAHSIDLKDPDCVKGFEAVADFIIFSEAFEHVMYPLQTFRNMLAMLKPKGRLFFSVQRIHDELVMNCYEHYAVTEKGLDMMAEKLNVSYLCKEHKPKSNWYAVIEKSYFNCTHIPMM
jgi:2-polyprenyl-3-methyl-5-hydroxy-6-metoxy-1,4-benzoquinol methylase